MDMLASERAKGRHIETFEAGTCVDMAPKLRLPTFVASQYQLHKQVLLFIVFASRWELEVENSSA